jgi:NAD(P)-dependent dehydrogenase (short-subunit alcohol dehydrogenase family)
VSGSVRDLGYRGRRVVVTGCASGIGRATARALLDQGAEVQGFDVAEADLPLAAFTRLDLRDVGAIDDAVAAIAVPVDALFNCAGIPPGRPPLDVMTVNFIGTRRLTVQLLAKMPPGSAVASVSSNGGAGWRAQLPQLRELIALEGFEAAVAWTRANADVVAEGYRFSKAALIVWTLTAAATVIRQGVRINCTLPGAVETPMLEEIERTTPRAAIDVVAQPIGRRSAADEQAWPLLMLNSPAAGYVNGAALPVDGGFLAGLELRPG